MRWLEQARVDLKWVRHLEGEGAYYLVCFLAQQAAEKALKAVLYARGEELVVGHSVRQLCQRVAREEARFAPHLEEWAVLDSYYIPTRYPNGFASGKPADYFTFEEAQEAVNAAREVLGFCKSHISG